MPPAATGHFHHIHSVGTQIKSRYYAVSGTFVLQHPTAGGVRGRRDDQSTHTPGPACTWDPRARCASALRCPGGGRRWGVLLKQSAACCTDPLGVLQRSLYPSESHSATGSQMRHSASVDPQRAGPHRQKCWLSPFAAAPYCTQAALRYTQPTGPRGASCATVAERDYYCGAADATPAACLPLLRVTRIHRALGERRRVR